MKKNEIKIGEHYAYQEHSYSRVYRVMVEAEAQIPKAKYPKYGNQNTVTGWRLRMADGGKFSVTGSNWTTTKVDTIDVPSRTLLATWADHVAAREASEKAQRKAAEHRLEGLTKKFRLLLQVSDAMDFLQPEREYREVTLRNGHAEAARAAGWTVTIGAIRTRLDLGHGYFDVSRDEVSLKDVAVLARAIVDTPEYTE